MYELYRLKLIDNSGQWWCEKLVIRFSFFEQALIYLKQLSFLFFFLILFIYKKTLLNDKSNINKHEIQHKLLVKTNSLGNLTTLQTWQIKTFLERTQTIRLQFSQTPKINSTIVNMINPHLRCYLRKMRDRFSRFWFSPLPSFSSILSLLSS